jgi:ketol-acid reductoisomerase
MTVIYFEDDADPSALQGRSAGVLGYGSLGRAFAQNLRDSGVSVLASADSGAELEAALEDGVPVEDAAEVARRCDVLIITTPDDALPEAYLAGIAPHLKANDLLIFTSGYTLAYRYVEPPTFVDVGLLAPRSSGEGMRGNYLNGTGSLAFVSVVQDASRQAFARVLAVAQGAGVLRAGAIEVSAEHEAQLALFVQQAIIPAFHHIMVTASELLIGQGIPPEAAFADLHIAGRFFDYLLQANRDGLMPTLLQQPLIAQYAALSRMARFSELRLERMMDDALRDIRGGAFAKEWLREQEEGLVRLNRLRKQENERPVWDYEQQTLDLMRDA